MAGKQIVAVMIAVTLAVVLLAPIVTAVNDNSGTVDATNESVTVELDEYQDLNGYNVEDGSETVQWYNSTSDSYDTLSEGSDYEVRNGPGELNVTSSSPASSGDEVLVSYSYQATSGSTTLVVGLISTLVGVLIIGVLGLEIQGMM